MYRPGIPSNMVVPESRAYREAKAAAQVFAGAGVLPAAATRWLTVEWLLFLNELPRTLSASQMEALDARFALTRAGNSEILSAWLEKAIRADYAAADPAVEAFLTRMGRRKFLRPLYTALHGNPRTRELARTIYRKARPGYHPIASATVDGILQWTP